MPTILLKKSDTASAVPTTANLTNLAGGVEVAVNTADRRMFTMTSASAVVELGTNPSSLTLTGGTANGVLYLNGSKVATSGSALTFDGTNFATSGSINAGSAKFLAFSASAPSSSNFALYGDGTTTVLNGPSGGVVQFNINNSEQMRLTTTGLGIGTTSPASLFHMAKGGGYAWQYMDSYGAGYYGILDSRCSRNSTVGSFTATNSGDTLLLIRASGTNSGATAFAQGASIDILQSGAAGATYVPAAIKFNTSDGTNAVTERMRLDSSGNLGLGVTPSAWTSNIKALEGASGGALSFYAAGGFPGTFITSNAYSDGTNWIAKVTDQACLYTLEGTTGKHIWSVAASNTTAGNAITFTQAMTLDSSGNLTIANGDITIGTNGKKLYTNYIANNSGTNLNFDAANFLFNTGNLGLGVTPSAWSVFKALQIGTNYGVINFSGIGGAIATNLYFDGTNYKYQTTNAAGLFDFGVTAVGGFAWRIAPSGTAGNNATLTQAMTLDASGNLFVGLTGVPTGWIPTRLTLRAVSSGDSDGLACFGSGSANNITLTHNGTVGVISADYATGGSYTPITFKTSNTERARITSGGNLLVGTTTDVSGRSGVISDVSGNVRAIPRTGSAKTSVYTLSISDVGQFVELGTGGGIDVPNGVFSTGDVVSVFNNTTGNRTISLTITTAYLAGTDADKASVTLATRGVATVLFISNSVCVVSGNVT